MKTFRFTFICLLLAAFPLMTSAQNNPVLVVEYMQVNPGMTGDYLEVEKTFKEIHRMRLEEGLITGWQLWKKVYSSEADEYHFFTINWYKNLAHSMQETPEGFYEKVMSTLNLSDEFYGKVLSSRTMVKTEVLHQAFTAENGKGSKYIQINEMKVKHGKENDYMKQEWEIWKPLQEKAIEKAYMDHWGVYVAWPYEKGTIRYRTVDGFSSIAQLTMADKEDLLPLVHPDKNWEEINEMIDGMRAIAAVGLFELVEAVFPEE